MQLYPFQLKLKHDIYQGYRDGHKNQVAVSATGSGKTVVMADIVKDINDDGKRVLTLTHKNEILEQTLKKYFLFGVQSGQISSGNPMTKEFSQVAMVQTLVNRLGVLQKPDLILIDEGHHGLAQTWKTILKPYNDVPKVYFTATPEMMNGVGMNSICTNMIHGPQPMELVNDGYLAYCLTFNPPSGFRKKFHKTNGDYDLKEQEEYYSQRSIYGNVIEHYRQYLDGSPTIVSCTTLKHCSEMVKHYNEYAKESKKSWVAVMVQGGQKHRKQREEALAGLASGSVQLVMFCNLLDEGVDVPFAIGCQMLRKTDSLRLCLQIGGRILRPVYKPGMPLTTRIERIAAQKNYIKPQAILLDHAGNTLTENHGHILSDRNWSLDSVEKSKRTEQPPTTTSCPKCYAVWPGTPRTCPECGFSFADNESVAAQQRKTPEQIAGELVAALPEGADPAKVKSLAGFVQRLQTFDAKTRQRAMIAKAAELQRGEIDALAKAVGYKPGWTHFVWTKVLKNRA